MIFEVIIYWNCIIYLYVFFFGGCYFVVDMFCCDFFFKLGEGKKYIECELVYRCGCIELLGDGNKWDVVFIEEIDKFGKVCKWMSEVVDFINDYNINFVFVYVF